MHGNYGILNDNCKFIKAFQVQSHHHLSVHASLILDGETVLIESPIPTTWNRMAERRGRVRSLLVTSNVRSVLTFGKGASLCYGTSPADAYNYFHINSIV